MNSQKSLRVSVVGAGVAGLTVSLALARQGHTVTVLDRDAADWPRHVGDAAIWRRTGVAQFHQPHAFLSRICTDLRGALPDVVDRMISAGAVDVELFDGLRSFWCRRSTLEWALRTTAEAEPGLTVRDEAVREVDVEGDRVAGVRLASGSLFPADLVVDCGGRRSRLSSAFAAVGAVSEPTNEIYQSRRYRLLPGGSFGEVNRGVIAVDEGDGYSTLVFPHDSGTFTVTFVNLPEDKQLTTRLRHREGFEAAARTVPMTARWTDGRNAEPISNVMVMSGLRNIYRPLAASAPAGLHALGDVVCTSNPHFGRGSAVAVAHALTLAGAVAENPAEPAVWRARVADWEAGELREWFEDGLSLDRSRAAMWRQVMNGANLSDGAPGTAGPTAAGPAATPPQATAAVPRIMVLAVAGCGADPVVAKAVMRHMHMVDLPSKLTDVEPRVAEMLAGGWRPSRPAGLPSRANLVAAVTAAVPGQEAELALDATELDTSELDTSEAVEVGRPTAAA